MGRCKKNPQKVFCVKVTTSEGEELYLKFNENENHSHYIRTDSLNEDFLNLVKVETKKQMDEQYGEGNYKVELLVYQNPKVAETLIGDSK